MPTKTTTFIESEAAKRRRRIYLLCGLVVVGCIAAFFLLSSGAEPAGTPGKTDSALASAGGAGGRLAPDRAGGATDPDQASAPRPLDDDPRRAALRAADALLDEGVALLKRAMTGDSGSDAASQARQEAHEKLMEARAAYEQYMVDYPEEESALDKRITELVGHIHWCRKNMTVAEIDGLVSPPAAEVPGNHGASHPPPAEGQPGTTRPPISAPRAVPPTPPFRPAQAAAKFNAAARRALMDGRPDRILELGRPLVGDPRMEGHLGDIPGMVALAEGMESVLDSARKTLGARIGEMLDLTLRKQQVSGILVSVAEGILLETADGERKLHVGDLAATPLLTLVELGGGLPDAEARRAVGAYFLLRGDETAGATQLIRARSQGADIEAFRKRIEVAMRKSPDLRALAAWYHLSPLLSGGSQDLQSLVGAFKKAHRHTEVFAEHREEIFRALARAAEEKPFRLSDLFVGDGKVDKRGVHLTYDFENPAQLTDFGMQGKWKIEEGGLVSDRGSIWLQRFQMRSVDFRFVLNEARPVIAGFWPRAGGSREGISLRIEVTPAGLSLNLNRRDRPFVRETVDLPRGEFEVAIQKREEKYQVWVNRKLVLKGTDKNHRRGQDPVAVGFTTHKEPLTVVEMEVKTGLDLEWALAGGTRFSTWVEDWHIAGPFAGPSKDIKGALTARWWPETEELDLKALDDGGKPKWRYTQVSGRLDLRAALRAREVGTAYAAVRVWSAKKTNAILEVQVDDDARVWLNGSLVLAEAPIGSAHRAAVKLEQGDNTLLVKVVDVGGGCWLKTRFLTKSGEPMRDLQYW